MGGLGSDGSRRTAGAQHSDVEQGVPEPTSFQQSPSSAALDLLKEPGRKKRNTLHWKGIDSVH